jgi:hypothetical protein
MKYIFSILFCVFLGLGAYQASAASNCVYSDGDIKSVFKNCNPDLWINPEANPNYQITESGSDFRTFTATMIRRIQIITSVLAIGIIVWVGLIMVLPVSAEAKEQYKAKIWSIMLGFFVMIAATIIVSWLINLTYEIFK